MAALVLCGLLLAFDAASALRITSKGHQRTIPNRLVFNYKVNLLQETDRLPKHTANIKKIVKMYPDMKVEFLDNAGCEQAIKAVHSEELAEYFAKEDFGPYKSDMCRLAQLAEKGGYYLDNDLEPVSDMLQIIPAQAAFVTAKSEFAGGSGLFQAFIGAAPKHPVIMKALNLTAAAYQSGARAKKNPIEMKVKKIEAVSEEGMLSAKYAQQSRWLGPHKMEEAFNWWQSTEDKGKLAQSYIISETNSPEPYGVSRQVGKGCCCNFVVADKVSKKALFYSRFVGSSDFCNVPGEPSMGERP